MDMDKLKARIEERKRLGLSAEEFDRKLRTDNREAIEKCIRLGIDRSSTPETIDKALAEQQAAFERAARLGLM